MQRWIEDPAKHLRWTFFCKSLLGSEANSEFCQASKMEIFAKTVKKENPLIKFVKTSILDVWQGPGYVSELASKVMDVSFLNQYECQR